MKKFSILMLTFAVALTMPLAAHAQPKNSAAHTKKAAAMYECPICNHEVNAAKAKSLHYTCPVDGGKLTLAKTAGQHKRLDSRVF